MKIIDKMWEFLENEVGISTETIDLITDINGYNETTMCDILYARTGYRDFDQIEEDFYEEDEDDD